MLPDGSANRLFLGALKVVSQGIGQESGSRIK